MLIDQSLTSFQPTVAELYRPKNSHQKPAGIQSLNSRLKLSLQIAITLLYCTFSISVHAGSLGTSPSVIVPNNRRACPLDASNISNAIINVPGLPDFSSLVQHVNICGEDDRVPAVDLPEGEALRAMGLLTSGKPITVMSAQKENGKTVIKEVTGIGNAGAFLVGPCLAMVNYHGVFGRSKAPQENNFDPSSFTATMSFDRGAGKAPIISKATAISLMWGAFHSGNPAEDWALVEVHSCPGKELGWFNIGKLNLESPAEVELRMAAPAPDKEGKGLWVDTKCRVHKWKDGAFFHDCGSRAGASGGMMYTIDNGVPTIVGMHVGPVKHYEEVIKGHCKNDQLNKAVAMSSLLDKIEFYVNEDIKKFGKPNPIALVKPQTSDSGKSNSLD